MPRPTDTIQDEMLVLGAQAGDSAAFESLLRRWLPVMRRHAGRVTGDAAAVDDVCQESCLALVGGMRHLRDPAGAYGWMLSIVTHKAVDWVRRKSQDRKLARTLQNREPRGAPDDPTSGSGQGERRAQIRAACRTLPADLRAAVSLYYGEGLPVAVIAGALGVPAGTVKSRLHEARARLRDQLNAVLERNTA